MNSCLAKWLFARPGRFVVVFVVALLLAGPFQTSVNQAGAVQQTPTIYYTALGDSVASGHGLPGEADTVADKDSYGCRISSLSYPVKTGERLGEIFGQEILPLNLACSGAAAGLDEDLREDKDLENQIKKAQDDIAEIPASSPILITVSIGANNFMRTGVLGNALNLSREDYYKYIDTTLANLELALDSMIGQLLEHPNVSIVMVTYASPVSAPYRHMCSDLSSYAPECLGDVKLDPLLRTDLYSQTMTRFDYFINRLNEVVGHDMYQKFADTGRIDYTQGLNNAFWGHDCLGPESWFECKNFIEDDNVGFLLDVVHPNATGAQEIANQVAVYAEPLIRNAIERLAGASEGADGGQGTSTVPTEAPPSEPPTSTCNDAGRPEQTSRLAASPQNADTTTEVMLSVTITNNSSCGTFVPTVLAIGGRDPAGNVTDPYQSRDFVLAPGESRTLDVPVVLSSPGTHEFFMAHQSGGWHRIPDTSGDSSSIYVTVTEAAPAQGPTEAPAAPTEAPPAPTEVASDPGVIVPVDGAVPDGEVAPMDIGAGGPSGHEIGAQFTVSMEDGTFLGSCTLEGDAMAPYPLSCQVDVPRYTTVVVTLDESTITPGLEPVQNPIIFDTSSQPGAASHWGVGFQLEAQGTTTIAAGPVDIAIYTTENGTAAYDACYVLVDYSNIGCDENRDGKVTFADIPFDTYTVRQTADLGPGRSVTDFTIQVSGQVNAEGYEPFAATIVSTETTTTTTTTTGGSVAVPSGTVDIALITRDPNGGSLLRDACYVLVDYSNVGCDENGDGQVTFADIPYGTYTVRQTKTPAGYQTINDYNIIVAPMPIDGGGTPPGVPMGFIVKQAPEQNAPNTRNVSVILVDGGTSERVVSGACVEIVGASNVGCDTDLLDGQIDFLDVPAGGPYELRLSNIQPGYEQVTVFGAPSVRIDAATGSPANVTVFVLLTASAASGGTTIQPIDSSTSDQPPAPASSGSVVEATVRMTFRGCPEGFVPDTVDPYAICTIPLDAPDASRVGKAGVDSTLVPIMGLQREYDGSYIFHASGEGGYSLVLTGLEPVLRDDFLIYGMDDYDGLSYVSQLDNGETREISVFYYYD